ncbi:hypothetical protein HDV04_001362 [Boothiomyces sp. JEL0838]|nr:hypothetical protein HDV04_001359 [Boothiomyces sp. JEL0838]KAJ3308361.1 hypothetical protein HDV04_001362 [Boothiomyces sp. JEL0838]
MSNKTWLHALMEIYEVDSKYYEDIYACLISKKFDTAEKCENLEEILSNMPMAKSEKFLRKVLETLETKSIDSLVNPSAYSQEIKMKKRSTEFLKDTKKESPYRKPVFKPEEKKIGTMNARVDTAEFIETQTSPKSDIGSRSSTIDDIQVPDLRKSELDKSLENIVNEHFQQLDLDAEFDPTIKQEEIELEECDTMTPIELLSSVFPDLDPVKIQSVLEIHHYNIEDAMDTLFNFDEESEAKKPSKQVCRHFLVGQCYRSDCWFSHDPDAVLCKFWLKGRCYKGDQCEFSHGQILEQLSQPKPTPVQQKAPPSIDDFPALGGKVPKKPTVDFLAPSFAYNDVLKKKPQAAQDKFSYNQNRYSNQRQGKANDLDVGWVSTGDNLSNLYMKYRTDAIDVALNRNRLFQRATEAYLAGNKAAARALSLSAHQLNNQLSYLNNKAASKIFSERNKHMVSSSGVPVIDLHGLHPVEAVEHLDNMLQDFVTQRYKGKVIIITGTGHHSRGKSKVYPYVKSHLDGKGWRPREGTLEDGKGGMLVVQI